MKKGSHEAKLLGPYFVSKEILPKDETEMIDQAKYIEISKAKLLCIYLLFCEAM